MSYVQRSICGLGVSCWTPTDFTKLTGYLWDRALASSLLVHFCVTSSNKILWRTEQFTCITAESPIEYAKFVQAGFLISWAEQPSSSDIKYAAFRHGEIIFEIPCNLLTEQFCSSWDAVVRFSNQVLCTVMRISSPDCADSGLGTWLRHWTELNALQSMAHSYRISQSQETSSEC